MKIKQVAKKPVVVTAVIVRDASAVSSPEGLRDAQVGDLLMTGTKGENWVVKPNDFEQRYEVLTAWDSVGETHLRCQAKPVPVNAYQTLDAVSFMTSWGEICNAAENSWIVRYGEGDYNAVREDIFNETYDILSDSELTEADFDILVF